MNKYVKTLTERRDYLSLRIQVKEKCGREYAEDEQERDALAWVVKILGPSQTPEPPNWAVDKSAD